MSRHKRPGLTRRSFGLALLGAMVASRARAVPADLAGWGDTRWGMNGDELAHVLGARLKRLSSPLRYSQYFVRETVPGLRLAGRPFIALLQLDQRSERLAQVLLRYPGDFPMLSDFVAVRGALAAELGPPAERRAETDYRGDIPSFWIEAEWTFPSTLVVISLVDQNADPFSGQRKTLTVRYTSRSGRK